MKKMPPYLLVRRAAPDDFGSMPEATPSQSPASPRRGTPPLAAEADAATRALASIEPQWARSIGALDPAFRKTVLDSCARSDEVARAARTGTPEPNEAAEAPRRAPSRGGSDGREYLETIARTLDQPHEVARIGVLDLGIWIAGLPDLLARLNSAQTAYALFEINAPVPSGLRKTPQGLAQWMRARGIAPTRAERAAFEDHVVDEEFFALARDIGAAMGLGTVVGLVPVMVAGESEDGVYWNHFSTVSEGLALVSTADLREFAARAGRPFEVAVGVLLIGALLVRFDPRLDYHRATRGCVLDYSQDRERLVDAIRALQLCPECIARMDEAQRQAAQAMLAALRKMKRRSR